MATWQLIDVGRTMIGKVPGMYEYVQNYAGQHFPKERADVLADLAGKRETNPELISQDVFSDFCTVWVAGYNSGQWKLNASEFVFPDTVPFVVDQKKQGYKIGVLTSGSKAFTDVLLSIKFSQPVVIGKAKYLGLPQLVDQYFLGEEWGDKNDFRSFQKIFSHIEDSCDNIEGVFDDKETVVEAALAASCDFPHIHRYPNYQAVWMNRVQKPHKKIEFVKSVLAETVDEFIRDMFFQEIANFGQYKKPNFNKRMGSVEDDM
jgi:methionine salvage enolase-phosphatase E1